MAKKTFIAKVETVKMANTVVVSIERAVPHPKYGKLIKTTRRLLVDTNKMEVKTGDIVKIEETKPMSKKKNFKIVGKEKQNGTA